MLVSRAISAWAQSALAVHGERRRCFEADSVRC
jgi:hypothetical protein